MQIVTKAASTSNDIMSKHEKFKQLLDINLKLGGTLDLISPTRELIKEGRIVKISARNGAEEERYLFLVRFRVCYSLQQADVLLAHLSFFL